MKNEITDEEILKAWGNANFCEPMDAKRNYLLCAVMKKAMGYQCGFTITQIMKKLQLLNKAELPNAKGRVFLRELYIPLKYKP